VSRTHRGPGKRIAADKLADVFDIDSEAEPAAPRARVSRHRHGRVASPARSRCEVMAK